MQIVRAARKLFLQRGYAGATIEAIARDAGVAKETVYAIFKRKEGILADLLDVSVGGDDQRVHILERPGTQANLRDSDQRRQLATFATHIADIMARAAPVFGIMRVAAKTEPEIARRLRRLYQERFDNLGIFVRHLAANGPLRDGMDPSRATEIVWGLSSAEVYQLMAQHRGWSKHEFARWLAETLERLLLA